MISKGEEIFLEYRPKITAYISAKVQNKEDKEDLVSEVFEKILKNMNRFDSKKASLSTWIYTITHNVVCNYYRAASKKSFALLDEHIYDSDSEDLAVSLCKKENLEILAKALSQLPERERDLIILRFYKGYTHEKTAKALSISVGNSKFLQNKAVKALKNFMEQPNLL